MRYRLSHLHVEKRGSVFVPVFNFSSVGLDLLNVMNVRVFEEILYGGCKMWPKFQPPHGSVILDW